MGAFAHTEAAVLVGGYDASGHVRSFDFGATATQLSGAETYGSGGYEEDVLGVKRCALSLAGLQSQGATGLGAYLDAGIGNQYALSVAIPGDAEGDPAWVLRGKVDSYGPVVGGEIDTLATFDLMARSDTAFGKGLLLQPRAEQGTAGNSTGVAMAGPTAAQSLYVALHITAVSSGTWTVLVESDSGSGFATPTTRLTFSTFTAQGWQFQSVAGDFSSETHLRVAWSVAGGSTPTASFAVAAFVI